MPTIKDVIIRKPSDKEIAAYKNWPVWKCQPSTFDWEYTERETCYIIEGSVTVSDKEGSVSFGPGDLVIFPEGLSCTWHIKETVVKNYSFG